jgi:hypothetical protein
VVWYSCGVKSTTITTKLHLDLDGLVVHSSSTHPHFSYSPLFLTDRIHVCTTVKTKHPRQLWYAVVRMWNQKSISIGETGYLQVYSQTNTTTSDVPRDYFDFEKKFKPPGDTQGEIFLDGVTWTHSPSGSWRGSEWTVLLLTDTFPPSSENDPNLKFDGREKASI